MNDHADQKIKDLLDQQYEPAFQRPPNEWTEIQMKIEKSIETPKTTWWLGFTGFVSAAAIAVIILIGNKQTDLTDQGDLITFISESYDYPDGEPLEIESTYLDLIE